MTWPSSPRSSACCMCQSQASLWAATTPSRSQRTQLALIPSWFAMMLLPTYIAILVKPCMYDSHVCMLEVVLQADRLPFAQVRAIAMQHQNRRRVARCSCTFEFYPTVHVRAECSQGSQIDDSMHGAQGEVTESQRELIAANWGKLNLSQKGVERAKQTMVAALSAASQGINMSHLTSRTASTSLAAEQVKAALQVTHLNCLERHSQRFVTSKLTAAYNRFQLDGSP